MAYDKSGISERMVQRAREARVDAEQNHGGVEGISTTGPRLDKYASQAQEGLFHSKDSPVSPKVVKEFDRATKGKHLPATKHDKHPTDDFGRAGKGARTEEQVSSHPHGIPGHPEVAVAPADAHEGPSGPLGKHEDPSFGKGGNVPSRSDASRSAHAGAKGYQPGDMTQAYLTGKARSWSNEASPSSIVDAETNKGGPVVGPQKGVGAGEHGNKGGDNWSSFGPNAPPEFEQREAVAGSQIVQDESIYQISKIGGYRTGAQPVPGMTNPGVDMSRNGLMPTIKGGYDGGNAQEGPRPLGYDAGIREQGGGITEPMNTPENITGGSGMEPMLEAGRAPPTTGPQVAGGGGNMTDGSWTDHYGHSKEMKAALDTLRGDAATRIDFLGLLEPIMKAAGQLADLEPAAPAEPKPQGHSVAYGLPELEAGAAGPDRIPNIPGPASAQGLARLPLAAPLHDPGTLAEDNDVPAVGSDVSSVRTFNTLRPLGATGLDIFGVPVNPNSAIAMPTDTTRDGRRK